MSKFSRRDFVRAGLMAGAATSLVPHSLCSVAAAQSAQTAKPSPYSYVDPELVPALEKFPTIAYSTEVLAKARQSKPWPALPAPAPQPYDRHIPGPTDNRDLRVVIVDPAPGSKDRPAFLHIHGGGYIGGTADEFPAFLQTVATSCNCLVVSVAYRLAPETRFPGSLEDNYAALRWIHTNADELGVDRRRIAIGGASAGGGHSAMLAIAARDRKELPIVFQLLIYPMLDDRTGSTRSVPPYIGHFIWNATSNRFGWTSLLGVPAGSISVPAGSVPARVDNLAGLPPAFIGVGSIDLFVDEDIEYAHRLINAGVPTDLLVLPGAYHGFDILVPDAAVSKQFEQAWKMALNRAYKRAS